MPTGGENLVSHLASEGVQHVFTVPGESFIAVLDAMHGDARVRPITCRNESGAAMMAEATGKLTGRPGVALVTRGPGAANALAGVYVAHQDATAMLLLVGLPPRDAMHRKPFQDIDLTAVFGSVTKWCAVVPDAARLGDYLARAFRTTLDGRSGPVVLGLPEDVLSETAAAIAPRPARVDRIAPSPEKLAHIRVALAHAERPLIIVGGSEWSSEAERDLAMFAERFDIPVAAAFRRQGHLDNRHRCYAGHAGLGIDPGLAAGIRASDCIIAVGTRLGDVTTEGQTLIRTTGNGQRLIHIAPDAASPDAAYPDALAIAASPIAAVAALARLDLPGKTPPWGIWRRDLHNAYQATLKPRPTPGRVRLEDVIATLSATLPEDAIICNGAGNYAAFLHRYFVYKGYGTQLAPVSGSMGYGLPAAIAAKLAAPDRTVIAIAGDGCFQMTGQELATAAQFNLPLVVIIANNSSLGTIRMHQESRYPGRVVATSLINPDFVSLAKSYGAYATRVETTDAFAPALENALASNGPAVIELATDIEALAPLATISGLRSAAKKTAP